MANVSLAMDIPNENKADVFIKQQEVGRYYILFEKFKKLKYAIEGIYEAAFHGFEQTMPVDYGENGLDDFGESYCPYSSILFQFEFPLLISLDEDTRFAMSNIAALEKRHSEGFRKFFPDLQFYQKNENDEMIPMSKSEVFDSEDNKYLQDIELSAIEIEWTKDLEAIKKIAESKGDFLEILKLL